MEAVICQSCADHTDWVLECAQPALDRVQDDPPALLSQDLLDFWLVMVFQGVVDNGSFQYLFERNLPAGITYARLGEALRRVGATEAAECLEKAVAMFPFEKAEADPERRIEFMRSQREDPAERNGPLDLLGDRAIDLSPFTYRKLAEHLQKRGLAPR